MAVASSFYVTGGTLRHDSPCYVERRADRELYDGLARGEFCYVLTARQMGKSSLMVRAASRLRESGARVAVLDLTAIGQNVNAEQWYNGLLGRIGHQLDCEDELEDFWLKHPHIGPLLRWLNALHEVVLKPGKTGAASGRVVLFMDEIDAVRSLAFPTDDFFAGIRECYNRRAEEPEFARLTFCLLGVATPADLIRDSRQTPFNLGRRVELSDFTPEEAAPLARGLGWQESQAGALLRRILYWTNGHPYLTQSLCQSVARDASVSGPAGVDRHCEALFLSHRAQERDDNLLFVREYLLRSQAGRMELLGFYSNVLRGDKVPDDPRDPLVSLLRLSGVSSVAGGMLRVRNRIYYRVFGRDWLAANLPGGPGLEVQSAHRRGVLRGAKAGFLAGVVLVLAIRLGLATMSTQTAPTAATGGGPEQRTFSARNLKLLGRPAEASKAQLDLSTLYNSTEFSDLSPAGLIELDGVKFDARGAIHLVTRKEFMQTDVRQGTESHFPGKGSVPAIIQYRQHPEYIENIPIGQKLRRLQMLHGASGFTVKDGEAIGSYVFEYADGQKWEVPIVFGRDVREDEALAASAIPTPTPAWSLKYPGYPKTGATRYNSGKAKVDVISRLYRSTYVNPFPDVPIRSLRINSALTDAAPLVIAITIEP